MNAYNSPLGMFLTTNKKNVDVVGNYYVRKNGRLGVNANTDNDYYCYTCETDAVILPITGADGFDCQSSESTCCGCRLKVLFFACYSSRGTVNDCCELHHLHPSCQ